MMTPWQDFGFRLVGSAGNGLDALQLVEKLEPDLLLTDIRMPFISGIDLARQVRDIQGRMNVEFNETCQARDAARRELDELVERA